MAEMNVPVNVPMTVVVNVAQDRSDADEFWPPQFADGYAAALRDAVEAVVNCDDYHSATNMLLVDAYREGLHAAREAIEALGGER